MQISTDTPRTGRQIGGKDANGNEVSVIVQVPQPFGAGAHELTEGEANALNQIVAENLSNNLRAKVVAGQLDDEGNPTGQPHTAETFQAVVDEYLGEYELGVRRTGTGERQVSDPVEREARKIAREKARDFVKSQGGKPADFDMAPITEAIFNANKDLLMSEGKKIVDRANKAAEGINLEGISLTPKAPANAEPEAEVAEEATA